MTLEKEISITLQNLGIPAHILGYQYAREAIKMVVKDFNKINYVTRSLYPDVAKEFKTTPSKVERAIRHAIETATTRNAAMHRVFNNGRPTTGEFIATIADGIRLERADCV